MKETKIIFLNQGGGLLFRELVISSVKEFESVLYYGPDEAESPQGVQIKKIPRQSNRGAIGRLANWVLFLLIGALNILREPGKPALFITTNPPVAPLLGLLGKKLKGQRYILMYYDIYPEALINFTGLSEGSIIARGWRLVNRLAIRNASAVITISPQLAKTLAQYQDQDGPRVYIVPTWVDTGFIRPIPKEENWFAKRNGQLGKLTILYSGNIGVVHDLSMLPELADRLREYEDVTFLVVGEGSGRNSLERECSRLQLENVTFLPLLEEATIPLSLSTGDIGIISIASGAEGISMPSKTYYLMAAGSALLGICSPGSDLAAVIKEFQCGVVVPPGDVEEAVRTILELRNDPPLLKRYRERARAAAENHFSRDVCVPRMLNIIHDSLQ